MINNLIGFLKSFFSTNKTLYFFYLKFWNNDEYLRIHNIDNNSIINISSPRTGNDFVKQLIKNSSSQKIISHLHRPANFDFFLKKRIGIFSILRDPRDSISSSILKYYSEKQLNKYPSYPIYDYYFFHKKLLQNLNHVKVYLFDDLIKNPNKFLENFYKDFNINVFELSFDKQKIFEKLYDNALDTNKNFYEYKGPSSLKNIRKKEVYNKLSKHYLMIKAIKLFEKIKYEVQKKDINF